MILLSDPQTDRRAPPCPGFEVMLKLMLLQPTVCQNHQSIVIIDTHYSVCISLVQFFLSFCHLFLPSFSFPYLVSLKPLLSKSFIALVTSFHVPETKYLTHKMKETFFFYYSYHTLPTIVIIPFGSCKNIPNE